MVLEQKSVSQALSKTFFSREKFFPMTHNRGCRAKPSGFLNIQVYTWQEEEWLALQPLSVF